MFLSASLLIGCVDSAGTGGESRYEDDGAKARVGADGGTTADGEAPTDTDSRPGAEMSPDAYPRPTQWEGKADGDWTIIDDALVQRLTTEGKLPPTDTPDRHYGLLGFDGPFRPSYRFPMFGPAAGVGCDPFTGDLYMGLMAAGIWKSTDQGETFSLAVESEMGGEYAGFFDADLDSPGRFVFFGADDDSLMTLDGGKTWKNLARPSKVSRGWNFGGIDWPNKVPTAILAVEHGAGARRFLSRDGGATVQAVSSGGSFDDQNDINTAVGVFDTSTFVTSDAKGIWRTTDAGATWTQVSDRASWGSQMMLRKGIAYFPTEQGLVMSKDEGLTWIQLGDTSVPFERGPWFESDDIIIAASAQGFYLTTDRGLHWSLIGPWPAGFYDPGKTGLKLRNHSSACWDPIHHTAYVNDFNNAAHKNDAPTVGTFTGHVFRLQFR